MGPEPGAATAARGGEGGHAAPPVRERLALHTWTLDTTPLPAALHAARAAGWPAVELRRVDFARAAAAGQPAEAVLALVQGCGLRVACVGGQLGWMFADGPARRQLVAAMTESCRWARAFGAPVVMSPADLGAGDLARAAAAVREIAAIAVAHGVRLAIEPPSQAAQLNTVARARELLGRAGAPGCGLLLDAYHLHRGGGGLRAVEDLDPAEIAYVQFSDVPGAGLRPGHTLDRLPPGQGIVPFREFFALLAEKGYAGPLSYEAPNPAAWGRDPVDVAREALRATLACLPGAP
ncbi:MAG TPA: sugar phosphate isomerase/epimerase family protein [Methylomirabilota bacterium]|jgi:2-keto-myo-inositol isomerase|nr:sugar phosphate isomerase/epimerase family protein [Methylomirabilota bacterium]